MRVPFFLSVAHKADAISLRVWNIRFEHQPADAIRLA
jgi:hypothetical protein